MIKVCKNKEKHYNLKVILFISAKLPCATCSRFSQIASHLAFSIFIFWDELIAEGNATFFCFVLFFSAQPFVHKFIIIPDTKWPELQLFIFTHLHLTSNAGFRLACRSSLCRYAMWSSLAVSELQLSAAMPVWLYHRTASLPSWMEFNCLRSAAVGKAAGLLIYWQDTAYRLDFPLRQVALAQLYKSRHQSGNVASGKLVWKQH